MITSNEKMTRRLGLLPRLMMLLCLLAGSGGAWATASCYGGGQGYTMTLPSPIAVPRDAPIGTVLATFSYSPAVSNIWTCTADPNLSIGAGYKGKDPLFNSPTLYTIAGKSVLVHYSNYPGVGVAFDVTEYSPVIPGCAGATNYQEHQNPYDGYAWGGCSSSAGIGPSPTGLRVGVALVKIGPIASGVMNPYLFGYGGASNRGMSPQIPAPGSSQVTYSLANPVQFVVLSCETPDVTVPLDTWVKSSFTGVGYTTNSVPVDIKLNNCPSGMNSISYRIDATTPIVSTPLSVVALDGTSAAAGVGVQLLDSNGTTPFPLATTKAFGLYSPATGGSYTIPLKARYYQTSPSVTVGTANTGMTFTMTYL